MSERFRNYLITTIIAVIMTIAIIFFRDITNKKELIDILHVLIDATFIVAVLFIGFGLLIYASNEGTFDMVSYGMISFISLFKKDRASYMKYSSYVDYKESKMDNKRSFGHIVIVGLIFFAISMALVAIYESL